MAPLFRRRGAAPVEFTVGVRNHRVIVGGSQAGALLLEDSHGYVEMVERHLGRRADGSDSAGVLSAKLDYADMVTEAVSVLVLTFEELVDRGIVTAEEVPERPPRDARTQQQLSHREFIALSYERAVSRKPWLDQCDRVLREHGVAVLQPVPEPG